MAKKQKNTNSGVAAGSGAAAESARIEASPVDAKALYLVVFLSGASLMGLEMAGARLVEPHFGSTIYVWGSIIGVFMLALSLGYWFGGRFADRSPKISTLGAILLVAALLALAIPPLAPGFCAWVKDAFEIDERYRTLIACLALFAPTSICMGMVSPFGVRLAASQVSLLGSVAGSLYAISTMGSIVGTFLVSFVLVEYIGTAAIVYGVGAMLALVAIYCFFQCGGGFRTAGSALAIIGIVVGHYGSSTPLTRVPAMDKLLEIKESAYHYITILDGTSQIYPYRKPARLMMFNNLIESGIILDGRTGELPPPPAETACGYVDLLHLGMVLTGHAPRNMLVIGCGGGVGPRMFKENYPGEVESIDVVDIDPWVFRLADKYFDYPFERPGEKVIRSHVVDGRMYVEGQDPDKKWDYIIMDAYSSGGRIPKHLITEEFFGTVRDHLTDDGVMIINVISAYRKPTAGPDYSRLFRAVYKTLNKVYGADRPEGGNLYVFPRNRSGQGENIIMLAAKSGVKRFGPRDIELSYRSIRNKYLSHTQLDEVIPRQLTAPPPVDDVPILTDDFCPTDSMVHR